MITNKGKRLCDLGGLPALIRWKLPKFGAAQNNLMPPTKELMWDACGVLDALLAMIVPLNFF